IPGILLVQDLEPASDGTSDFYAGLWVGPVVRLHETGEGDTSFRANFNARGGSIAVALDGTGDVLLASAAPETLFRFNRSGALVSAPTFVSPDLAQGGVGPIVPVPDGTGDFYIGGVLTTYNGVIVNNFARVHADGSLASVVK